MKLPLRRLNPAPLSTPTFRPIIAPLERPYRSLQAVRCPQSHWPAARASLGHRAPGLGTPVCVLRTCVGVLLNLFDPSCILPVCELNKHMRPSLLYGNPCMSGLWTPHLISPSLGSIHPPAHLLERLHHIIPHSRHRHLLLPLLCLPLLPLLGQEGADGPIGCVCASCRNREPIILSLCTFIPHATNRLVVSERPHMLTPPPPFPQQHTYVYSSAYTRTHVHEPDTPVLDTAGRDPVKRPQIRVDVQCEPVRRDPPGGGHPDGGDLGAAAVGP